MKRSTSIAVHAATLAIGASGLVWGWMRYVYDPGAEPDDPELMLEWTGAHAAEPLVRTLHLIAAPLAVFAIGTIWVAHVSPRLLRPWARRATGLTLAALLAPMVLSGVLLQTASTPEQRGLWVWVHGISSAVWLLAYVSHQLRPRTRRSSSSDEELHL